MYIYKDIYMYIYIYRYLDINIYRQGSAAENGAPVGGGG